jgi:hypothetical protein
MTAEPLCETSGSLGGKSAGERRKIRVSCERMPWDAAGYFTIGSDNHSIGVNS